MKVFAMCIALSLVAYGSAGARDEGRHWVFGGQGGESWPDWVLINVMADDFSVPGTLQPRLLKPDENLLPLLFHTVPWERYQVPANPFWEDGLPRLWRWTGNRARDYYTPFTNYIDGDLKTFNWSAPATHVKEEWYTIDVGVPIPAERFVISMPEGFDRIGRPWTAYVPKAGELSATLSETEIFGEGDRSDWWEYQPLQSVLGGVNQNLQAPIEITFPTQFFRFFRWITFPEEILPSGRASIEALAYAEMELYGRGFAAEAYYTTKVIDTGGAISVGRLFMEVSNWRLRDGGIVQVEDADAAVTVQVKTGLDDDPRSYFTWNDQSELVEIPIEGYQMLKGRNRETKDPKFVGWQGPIGLDRANWSSWSGAVSQSGTYLEVPTGRYLQVRVQMASAAPTDVARLDSLSIELVSLLVPNVLGEIGLQDAPVQNGVPQVTVGEAVDLTYAIRADFHGEDADGFDGVTIAVPGGSEFRYLQMGSPPDDVQPDSVRVSGSGLTLYLPRSILVDEEVRIGLRATLFTVSTQVRGHVFNRDNVIRRQQIHAGDAADDLSADGVHIVAEGGGISRVLSDVEIAPAMITPNGDNRNDQLTVTYKLFGVLHAEVEVAFYALDGRRMHSIVETGLHAGKYVTRWDGADRDGNLLDPGIYLCTVTAVTGRGRFGITRLVGLIY